MTVKQQYVLIDGVWQPTGGPPGEKGDQGDQGPKGDMGSTGLQGGQGPKGDKGDKGDPGNQGLTGGTGPAGPKGAQGEVSVVDTFTGAPGTNVIITDSNPSPNIAALAFTIPRGDKGDKGDPGTPSDLSKAKADTLYEPKSELLKEAAWYVDAGVIGTGNDRLLDITGRGRDAVFGAAAAAPVVLPWSGEDYVHFSSGTNSLQIANPTWNVAQVTIKGVFTTSGAVSQFVQVGDSGAGNGWHMRLDATGKVGSTRFNAAVGTIMSTKSMTKLWNRFTHTATPTATTVWEESDDGAAWTTADTLSNGAAPAPLTGIIRIGGGSTAGATPGKIYSLSIVLDGVLSHSVDPRNVSADYSTITNTGSAGGNWTITRATTGYKTAVVDRPLLLFGGAQNFRTTTAPDIRTGTIVVARRRFTSTNLLRGLNMTLTNAAAEGGCYEYQNVVSGVITSIYNPVILVTHTPVTGSQVMSWTFNGTTLRTSTNGTYLSVATGTTQRLLGLAMGYGYSSNSVEEEFVGMAVWDRILTDAEIAEVSLDLAGVPHDKQPDPHPQYVLESQVGNLLTENQAAGLGGVYAPVTGWTLTEGVVDPTGSGLKVASLTYATPVASATRFLYGGASTAANSGATSGTIPVTPGQMYHFEFEAWTGTITSGIPSIDAQIGWWTSAGNVAASTPSSTTGLLTAGTVPVKWIVQGVAPPDAAFASCNVRKGTAGSIQTVYVRRPGFWRGLSGDWSMPGVPITGTQSAWEQVALLADLPATGNWLGRKIQVTSGLGYPANTGQIMVWNGTAWVVAPESDTGLLTSFGGAWTNITITRSQLRRVGNMCSMTVYGTFTASTTDVQLALNVLAAGFRPQTDDNYTSFIWWDGKGSTTTQLGGVVGISATGNLFVYGVTSGRKCFIVINWPAPANAWPTTA